MAEKEERILIDVINPGINCVYRLDNDPKGKSLCKHNGNMEPVTAKECRHCDEGMTRTEIINRMAKGIHFYEWGHHNNMPKWDELNSDIQNDYRNMAEAALNALLEEKI